MEIILAAITGVGLSAACGFRVFLPLLAAGLAGRWGYLRPAEGFEWLATTPALVALTLATTIEVVCYFVPWLDHLLDTVAGPAAIVAGTVVAASAMTGMSPWLSWSLAVIAGGGGAGVVQGATTVTRLASTATTGGFGNPIVALLEAIGAAVLSLLAILLPVVGLTIALLLMFLALRIMLRAFRRRRTTEPVP